jgi:hypothetical protein
VTAASDRSIRDAVRRFYRAPGGRDKDSIEVAISRGVGCGLAGGAPVRT